MFARSRVAVQLYTILYARQAGLDSVGEDWGGGGCCGLPTILALLTAAAVATAARRSLLLLLGRPVQNVLICLPSISVSSPCRSKQDECQP